MRTYLWELPLLLVGFQYLLDSIARKISRLYIKYYTATYVEVEGFLREVPLLVVASGCSRLTADRFAVADRAVRVVARVPEAKNKTRLVNCVNYCVAVLLAKICTVHFLISLCTSLSLPAIDFADFDLRQRWKPDT